jgi:hypothetical protein
MALQVSDTASNRRDQIANFAEILRKAPSRQKIFRAVYHGKKRSKTVQEIADATKKFTAKRVTEIAKPLVREKLFDQARERIDGSMLTVYRKNEFVASNRRKILQLARDKKRLGGYHTKTNPVGSRAAKKLVLRLPFIPKTRFIAVDDIEQFSRVKKIKNIPERLNPERLPERSVKRGILRVLQEAKNPKDWGGESNDIFSVKLRVRGSRRRAAFALKGPAKKGILVPAMMGKNGDQIQRLFGSPADVFFVQYEGEIAESVVTLMEQLAKARAVLGGEILFGIIDRDDTYRLRLAFPRAFR